MCRAIDLLIADGEKRGEKRGEQRGMKRGMERGFKRGEKHGLKHGIEQGIERGTVHGIVAMVSVLRDYNVEDADIIQKIQEKFGISPEEARKYVQSF